MATVMMKTHLIVKDQYDEYDVKWVKSLATTHPKFKDDKIVFAIISNKGRMEIATMNFPYLEKQAKKFTMPKGRGSVTVDKGYIYVVQDDGTEEMVAIVTHSHIRKYAPMYDPVEI